MGTKCALSKILSSYIPHLSLGSFMAVYSSSIGCDRTSACKDASGCRYQFIFDLTHPPTQPMHGKIDHHTGTTSPTLFDPCGSLTSHANHVILNMLETGPTVYSPYPRTSNNLKIHLQRPRYF